MYICIYTFERTTLREREPILRHCTCLRGNKRCDALSVPLCTISGFDRREFISSRGYDGVRTGLAISSTGLLAEGEAWNWPLCLRLHTISLVFGKPKGNARTEAVIVPSSTVLISSNDGNAKQGWVATLGQLHKAVCRVLLLPYIPASVECV
jgi:hypothetical protein